MTHFSARLAYARWLCWMLVLCLANFRLFWAETGCIFQSATLYTLFSESKKSPTRMKGKRFSRLNRRATGARMGLVSTRELVDIMSGFAPCHAAVCVNFILGAKVLFLLLFCSQHDSFFCPAAYARWLCWILIMCFSLFIAVCFLIFLAKNKNLWYTVIEYMFRKSNPIFYPKGSAKPWNVRHADTLKARFSIRAPQTKAQV